MMQVLQDLRSGSTFVENVPMPVTSAASLGVAASVSLISAGTERMLVDFARGSLLSKARQQPDKVKEALQKIRTDGLQPTIEAIRSKLEQPLALGYSHVGRIVEVGSGVAGFEIGQRVVSNGKHAEFVVVPHTLCAGIPDAVSDESAAFTVVGAVALQGVRLAQPTLGECFVVIGLGLVGLMAVQMLRANGCRVLGIDRDRGRVELARRFGAEAVDSDEDPVAAAAAFSGGRGVDGVLLAAATQSSEPVSQAAQMCRKRGRIVLVGVTGLTLRRADFYEKELSFQVSCSYGPGRYDPEYEDKGQDYPLGFVRWTVQRNFEAVLELMARGALDVGPLITHRFPVRDAPQAYDVLGSREKSLGILITYGRSAGPAARKVTLAPSARDDRVPSASAAVTGFLGAGNYAGRVLMKAFQDAQASFHTVVSANGVSAAYYGRKFGFANIATTPQTIFDDAAIDTVCIATRHDSHARYVCEAIRAGKNVFVEKPLCISTEELDAIAQAIAAAQAAGQRPALMVGFNRRFAPLVVRAKSLLAKAPEPKSIVMTINAGALPATHWTQDPQVGGGRLVGEACHFIDLSRHLVGAPISGIEVASLRPPGGQACPDSAVITLHFADGSIAAINYFANGHKGLAKERFEIFCGGRVLLLDNFRKLTGYGWRGFASARAWKQDKGQTDCVAAFVQALKAGKPAPIPLDEIVEVSRAAIEAAAQA